MKMLLILALAAALPPRAAARVWTDVYRYDGQTPLRPADANHPDVYRDIMVGTRLTLVIRSDTSDYWLGRLLLSWEEAPYGRLSGRGYTPPSPSSPLRIPTYRGSCLDAAGTKALVYDRMDSEGIGLFFNTDHTPYISGGHPAYPGDWFVVDYCAEQVGECAVGLYDLHISSTAPTQTVSFTHVPSRDFNADTVVNLKDFAWFASQWRSAADPHAAFDLNPDRRVDGADLASFSRHWLERTDSNEPPALSGPATTP